MKENLKPKRMKHENHHHLRTTVPRRKKALANYPHEEKPHVNHLDEFHVSYYWFYLKHGGWKIDFISCLE
jgi:hypothetical protein